MAKLTPRWYQAEAREAVMAALTTASNVHPVAAIVTGGGKALLVAMLMESINLQWPGARVMNLAPSMELVKQNTDEAVGYLPAALVSRIGVYCAGLRMKDKLSQFVFGTPQSVVRQAKRFGKIDFVIVDEAHVFDVGAKTARKIVDDLAANNPGVRFIGLTATPFRMKGLTVVPLTQCGLFDAKVYDLTSGRNYNRLTREGFITQVVAPTIRFPQIDTEGVKTKGGDFDDAELARRAMEVTQQCVEVALAHTEGRKHLMWFAVNIEHARMIQSALEAAREASVLIHGDLDRGERVEGIESYLARQHRHIVSVAMLTTGFNAKFVDALVVLRPTRSLVLWRQIVGRGLRPYEGKDNILILDAGGNLDRHGPLNADSATGDSRAGLWQCTEEVMHAPAKAGKPGPLRERSSLRFPTHSPEQPECDLRLVLGLMEPETPACGYLNDTEHMLCRQCGRPRQGFLALRQRRDKTERGMFAEGDSYDLHDEDAVILRDEVCRETRVLEVQAMTVTPEGNSVLAFEYQTEFGPYKLRLDFDRHGDNKFFAQARKLFETATGRKVPSEAYRVLLQRDLIPAPLDITLTKCEDGRVYLTEARFLREGNLAAFRYDPKY
jgi:superfamily II DNA or RNA helicase